MGTANYFLLMVAIISFSSPDNAYAYLDPGTGGIIGQSVLAVVVGVMVALRAWRHKIAKFFGFGDKSKEKPK